MYAVWRAVKLEKELWTPVDIHNPVAVQRENRNGDSSF